MVAYCTVHPSPTKKMSLTIANSSQRWNSSMMPESIRTTFLKIDPSNWEKSTAGTVPSQPLQSGYTWTITASDESSHKEEAIEGQSSLTSFQPESLPASFA